MAVIGKTGLEERYKEHKRTELHVKQTHHLLLN